ncbi:M14 family zinc carboxypeptidase, partial [Streptosporangium sp. NPDC005286]|uniref:M14 family zinc carboxypeptidase n=1 Tax=Streptosporangium sp. NPDC005286 TaxID=3154463 RepID=UPI00339FCCAE
ERLLRNYARDGQTKKLVDDLDIFIMPTSNPDPMRVPAAKALHSQRRTRRRARRRSTPSRDVP